VNSTAAAVVHIYLFVDALPAAEAEAVVADEAALSPNAGGRRVGGAEQTFPHAPQFLTSVARLVQMTVPPPPETSPHTVPPAAWQFSQLCVQIFWAGWVSGCFLQ
jgi:hypothetical protein